MNLDFPFHFDGRGRTASTTDIDHLRDMVEQLLFTAPGERVNRPDFGTGVGQLVFAPNSEQLAAALQMMIQGSMQRWLGDVVRIDRLSVNAIDEQLQVEVVYTILETGQTVETTVSRNN